MQYYKDGLGLAPSKKIYSATPNFPTATKNKSLTTPPTGPGRVSNAPRNPDFALKSPVGNFLLLSKDFAIFLDVIAF